MTIAHPHSRARAPTRTERASDDRDGVSRESSVRRVVFGADDARWCARGAGDDVVGEFETDKNAEVTGELPKIDVPKQMPGWGGWAEDQAKRGPPKWQLEAERKAKREQQKALKARRDADLKHVVISERYDKKVAGFNVEHLPHGFDSKAVYEGSMRMPLGPDANTDKSFRDMTRPAVLKAAGTVIRPMTFPKGRQAKKKA